MSTFYSDLIPLRRHFKRQVFFNPTLSEPVLINAHNREETKWPCLHLIVDHGTAVLSMAVAILGTPNNVDQVVSIGPQRDTRTTPQLLTYVNGKLVWGDEADRLDKPYQDDIIRCLKLYIDEAHKDSAGGRVVHEQLKRWNKIDYQVIGEHLKQIFLRVKPEFRSKIGSQLWSKEKIAGMPLQVTILVPAAWSAGARHTMTAAALIARQNIARKIAEGDIAVDDMCHITNIQTATESSVAISLFNKELLSSAQQEDQGPFKVILADGGGSTLVSTRPWVFRKYSIDSL